MVGVISFGAYLNVAILFFKYIWIVFLIKKNCHLMKNFWVGLEQITSIKSNSKVGKCCGKNLPQFYHSFKTNHENL